MKRFAFDSWIGIGLAVAAVAALSVLVLPTGLALKGLGVTLALAALAVSIVLQVRNGRRSTWDVIQDVDHEPVPVAARALSGTIDLKGRHAR